jgi:hypothetical protein
MLVWENEDIYTSDLVRVVRCSLNPCFLDLDGVLKAYICIDDILASAVNKVWCKPM